MLRCPKLLVTIEGFLVNAIYAESEATNNTPEPKGNSGTAVYSSDSATMMLVHLIIDKFQSVCNYVWNRYV